MIRSFLILFMMVSAQAGAKSKSLYACDIQDVWLQKQKLSGHLEVYDLDRAEIKIQSDSETVSCPLNVETVQDASRGKVAQVIFKMVPERCSPAEKSFNKNLRGYMTFTVSTQPKAIPSAQLAWRNRTGYSGCRERVNNLKEHGLGYRAPSVPVFEEKGHR